MKKLIVFLVAAVLGFSASVWFTADPAERQAALVSASTNDASHARCVRQVSSQMPEYADSICSCMLSEFESRGLAVTDAFGAAKREMQDITQSCVAVYGG